MGLVGIGGVGDDVIVHHRWGSQLITTLSLGARGYLARLVVDLL